MVFVAVSLAKPPLYDFVGPYNGGDVIDTDDNEEPIGLRQQQQQPVSKLPRVTNEMHQELMQQFEEASKMAEKIKQSCKDTTIKTVRGIVETKKVQDCNGKLEIIKAFSEKLIAGREAAQVIRKSIDESKDEFENKEAKSASKRIFPFVIPVLVRAVIPYLVYTQWSAYLAGGVFILKKLL